MNPNRKVFQLMLVLIFIIGAILACATGGGTETEPSPTEIQIIPVEYRTGYVIPESVILRSGPGIEYEAIGSLSRDSSVTITGKSTDGQWYVIESQKYADYSMKIWLLAEFVGFEAPVTKEPILAELITPTHTLTLSALITVESPTNTKTFETFTPTHAFHTSTPPALITVESPTFTRTTMYTPTNTSPPLSFMEDCLPFNTSNVRLSESNGNWWVVEYSSMLYFGTNNLEAQEALNIIQLYRMNNHCFVGRPDASLEYWLVNNGPPMGSYPGEDCVSFNLGNIEVVNINGRWKIVEGSHWILDFADVEEEARQSYEILQHYGFNRICFVGRPDASMTYFRR